MNKSRKSFTLEEYKIQTSLLLKSLRGNDAEKAAKRFKHLSEFADLSIADILQKNMFVRQLVLAINNCFHEHIGQDLQTP